MFSILLIIAVLIISFWFIIIKPGRYWSDRGVKQTITVPFLGDLWHTFLRQKSLAESFLLLYNKFPNERYFGFYQFTLPTLLIKDPELIKQITIRDFDYFTDHRNFVDPDVDPLWSGNLFSLHGQKWREMRATLSGSFTSSKIKVIFGLMEETATSFVDYFLDKKEDLIEVEFKDCMTRYANDVIATSAFGIKVDSLRERKNTFYLMGKEITNLNGLLKTLSFLVVFLVPKLSKYFRISPFNKHATKYFENIIKNTINTREEKGIVRPDMINLLLETRKGVNHEEKGIVDTGYSTVKEFNTNAAFKTAKNITNDDIVSQALIFFFAGFDTVSTAISFGLYELAVNRDVQDKLRQEISKTHKEVNGKITYDELLHIKYLDMVVSEMLRKWPPQLGMDRICTKPYTIEPVLPHEKPILIKKDESLWLPYIGIHRNPDFYPDPDKFDPERFSPENKEKIVPYTYMPFGSGPRNCIGSRYALLEVKVLLFKLLLNFEIVPTAKTTIPLKLDKKSFQHLPENGFWLGLKRIKHDD